MSFSMDKVNNEGFDPGINFHKLTKNLSNNALKYLINVCRQESYRRRNKRKFPQYENKELPVLMFDQNTIFNIRNEKFKAISYDIGTGDLTQVSSMVNLDMKTLDWQNMAKNNTPVKIVLQNETGETKQVELHSRSKIFWLYQTMQDIKNVEDEEIEDEKNFNTWNYKEGA